MSIVPRSLAKTSLRHATAAVGRMTSWISRPDDDAPRVLCYHGVCDDPPDEWSVTPAQLREHMRLVRRDRVPVTLERLVAWLRGEASIVPRAVAVTFDDGFLDLLTHAAPVLADAGVPATAFIAPGLLSGDAAHASYVPSRPIMNWDQAGELAGLEGWSIGSHSLTHPQLAALGPEEARGQISESKAILEQRLGRAVTLLAYPYGTAHTVSTRDQHLAAEAGYEAAFMDMTGPLSTSCDLMALPRTKVLGTDRSFVVKASLAGAMDLWGLVERRH